MWYSAHVSRRQYQIGMLTIHSGHDDCNLRTSGGRYWKEIPCYWEADMVNAETRSSWVDAGGWDLTGSCSTLMLRSWYFRARHQEGVLMRTSDDTSRQTLLPSDCPVDINAVGFFKHDVVFSRSWCKNCCYVLMRWRSSKHQSWVVGQPKSAYCGKCTWTALQLWDIDDVKVLFVSRNIYISCLSFGFEHSPFSSSTSCGEPFT